MPEHLIEQANSFQLSDQFVRACATNPHEMHNFGRPIFPAIAIPVQTKTEDHFECPMVLRSYLRERLTEITKVLIIGWQAREAHFLEMLRFNMPRLTHLMVVAANDADAQEILRYFEGEIRLNVPYEWTGQGGFTNFIVNQEGSDFFCA